jgi:hypothetical protein
MKNIFRFYKNACGLIVLVNILLYAVFGMYFEDYESFFSTFLHGTYTRPWGVEVDCSSHIGLLYLYEYLAAFFVHYNFYGIVLFFFNVAGFLLLGLVLYRILKVNLGSDSMLMFGLLYLLLCLDSFINVHSTRQTFIFLISIVGYLESCRSEGKDIHPLKWCIITALYIIIALTRFESVWLFGLIYLALLILHKRFYGASLLPLIISGAILLIFYNVLVPKINEPKQTYIYKERELYDRENIDYEKLNPAQQLEIEAIMKYGITDKEFFTLGFYDSISKYNSNNSIFSLSDGIKPDAFRSSLAKSGQEFFYARIYLLIYFLTSILIFISLKGSRKKIVLHTGLVCSVPLLLCLYTIVPLRFLVPYLTIFSTLNLFWLLQHRRRHWPAVAWVLFFLVLAVPQTFQAKKKYQERAGMKLTGSGIPAPRSLFIIFSPGSIFRSNSWITSSGSRRYF